MKVAPFHVRYFVSLMSGGSTREKEGIPRVVEALHCCLWSKAHLKRRQKKQCGLTLPLPTQSTNPETATVNTDPLPYEKDEDDASFASSQDIEYRPLSDYANDEETLLPSEGEGSIHNAQTEIRMETQVAGSLCSNMAVNQQFDESLTTERQDCKEADGLLANDSLGRGSYDDEEGCIAVSVTKQHEIMSEL